MHEDQLCYYCNSGNERILHLFYSCAVIRKIWDKLEKFIIYNVKLEDTIVFRPKRDIQYCSHGSRTYSKYDGTYYKTVYIYIEYAVLLQPLTFQNIVLEICRIQSYELYYAKAKGKVIKHWKKWAPLHQEY